MTDGFKYLQYNSYINENQKIGQFEFFKNIFFERGIEYESYR